MAYIFESAKIAHAAVATVAVILVFLEKVKRHRHHHINTIVICAAYLYPRKRLSSSRQLRRRDFIIACFSGLSIMLNHICCVANYMFYTLYIYK